jgi:Uma2 family endonuclease
MIALTRPRYSVEEYVRLEEYANLKHEYLDGYIWAMAGGTLEHADMAGAIIVAFGIHLRDRPCRIFTADARVRVVKTGLDTYPDVSVVCGPVERDKEDKHAMTNPMVLVEVTSDSTEAYDRGDKLDHYKQIPSLQEVVIVSHRTAHIEVHRRGADGTWSKSEANAGESIAVDSVGCTLAADEIFRAPLSA